MLGLLKTDMPCLNQIEVEKQVRPLAHVLMRFQLPVQPTTLPTQLASAVALGNLLISLRLCCFIHIMLIMSVPVF